MKVMKKKKLKIEFFKHGRDSFFGRVTIPASGRTLFGKRGQKHVELPEMYFYVYFSKYEGRLFFYELHIERKSDGFTPRLPNTDCGYVCLGGGASFIDEIPFKSPVDLCEEVVSRFWQTRFSSAVAEEIKFDSVYFRFVPKSANKTTIANIKKKK